MLDTAASSSWPAIASMVALGSRADGAPLGFVSFLLNSPRWIAQDRIRKIRHRQKAVVILMARRGSRNG